MKTTTINYLKRVWRILLLETLQESCIRILIPGVFTREYEEEGNTITEKIHIETESNGGGVHTVWKEIIKEISPEETHIYTPDDQQWTAVYDKSRKQLLEVDGNRSCTFLVEDFILLLEGNEYERL